MKIKNTVGSSIFFAGVFAFFFAGSLSAKENKLTIKSPDGDITVAVSAGEHLGYAVDFHGQHVLGKSALGIIVDSHDLGENVAFAGKIEKKTINEQYHTRGVHDTAINHCNVAVISLTSGGTQWQLEVRVFNDGVACQYRVPGSGSRHIDGESTEWTVPVGSILWHQDENNASYESKFYSDVVGQLAKGLKLMAPATLKFPGDTGYGMMTEANLISYSDMALQTSGENTFKALFPPPFQSRQPSSTR